MERLIAVVGPTAVGKTQISIDLAKKLNTEIISGDSMLVYRGCDIGTAKPSIQERQGISHYLIDVLGPNADFSVADFQQLAGEIIKNINQNGKIPILAGGTGLYVKSLIEGYRFSPAVSDENLRRHLTEVADQQGNNYLHEMLQKVSPIAAARLHPNDRRRIIRALETYQLTGEDVSQYKQAQQETLIYNAAIIGLTMDRGRLYERINQRVDIMISSGLVEEVEQLIKNGVNPDGQAMQGIGYKEIIKYLKGEVSLPVAIELIKKATRNFAKRQLTWYRRMPYIYWVDMDQFNEYDKIMAYIYSCVAGKFYIK